MLTFGLHRCLMPGGSELAAAADIGDHIDAAMAEPQPPEIGAVGRCQRYLEAAIAIKNGRRGAGKTFRPCDEIGNFRSVLADSLELFADHPRSIEARRQGFDRLDMAIAAVEKDAGRGQVILETVHRLRPVIVGRDDTSRALSRQVELAVRPMAAIKCE